MTKERQYAFDRLGMLDRAWRNAYSKGDSPEMRRLEREIRKVTDEITGRK